MKTELSKYEELNIRYILLYLQTRPPNGTHLRTFLDDWFAYYRGGDFLTRNMTPRWHNKPTWKKDGLAFKQMHFISRGAVRVYKGLSNEILVKDHSIPIAVIRTMLLELEEPNARNIREFLISFYSLGVLTKDEDIKLNHQGLRSSMPLDWDRKDLFARYKDANIIQATKDEIDCLN